MSDALTPPPDRHRQDRLRMVETQIAARGVRDPRVLQALEAIPRHRFVGDAERRRAHTDRALPIDCGQTISQPYIVGAMTEALAPRRDQRVLEIGTGSGYQTAVLSRLAGAVYSVERIPELSAAAQALLADLAHEGLVDDNVRYRVGDGTLGWPEHAPYDGILVAAGAPDVPQALLDQLGDGGRLVAPVGDREGQDLLLITRRGDRLERRELFRCAFVPLLGDQGWAS